MKTKDKPIRNRVTIVAAIETAKQLLVNLSVQFLRIFGSAKTVLISHATLSEFFPKH
jgi:hypothetical protein